MIFVSDNRGWTLTEILDMTEEDLLGWVQAISRMNEHRNQAQGG